MKFHRAIKLILKEGTMFDLYFENGKVKRYDIISLASKFPQINALKDRKLFLKGTLSGWSGVVWNDELDIDAESVYEYGVDVTNEYNDIWLICLGYSIKKARLENNLTQEKAAQLIGIDQSDLSKIEKGLANPTVKMLKRISNALEKDFVVRIE